MWMSPGTERGPSAWYLRCRMGHTAAAAAVTVVFILLYLARGRDSAALPSVPNRAEMTTLAIVLALFGVPHGATDHLVAAAIFKRQFPRAWLAVFVAVYLAMMGAVVLCWRIAPTFSLASFLLMSVVHWGLGDAEEDLLSSRHMLALEVCVRGSIPILLPCVSFPAQVTAIFAWLVGPHAETDDLATILRAAHLSTAPFSLALVACIAYHTAAAWGTHLRPPPARTRMQTPVALQTWRHLYTSVELLLLPALCVVCPPLTSFMIYFCLWHSVRHILCVSSATFDALRWQATSVFVCERDRDRQNDRQAGSE